MLAALIAVVAPVPAAPHVAAGTPALPEFEEDLVFSGLANPTAVAFAPDGRIFVAEKRGTIKVFDSLADTSGALWADLRTQVHNYWDRGLLGMAVDPDFPSPARIYVSYTHDGVIGGVTPRWGTADTDTDPCPNPPGGTGNGCVVSSRVSALTQGAGSALATEQVLLEDWCQQYPSHSIGDVAVGPDGALYIGHGEGASFNYSDYGQQNAGVAADPNFPNNPCDDPPGGVGGSMTLPTAEGGALRAQDLRTPGDPLTLDGSMVRIDRFTGAGLAGNPLIGSADLNARRMIAHGLRNPFRIAFRPGTSELWVADVGSSKADEVDRIVDTTPASVLNYGWPCREGLTTGPSTFQSADLCLTLGATEAPYFSYLRSAPVTDPDCTAGGTASIAGLAFAQGNSFPSGYSGALFIADYARDCIWAMPAGTNGLPDPAAVFKFADASNPVMLKIGPDGNLYYVDYGGAVRRIRAAGPQAAVSADQTSGPLPLQVQFDGSGSSVVVGPISHAWDLDGDGQFDDSTAVAPSWTYTSAGEVTVSLRVTDGNAQTDTETLGLHPGNLLPIPVIATPLASLTWAVGDQVSFSGSATDPEEGSLSAEDLHWSLLVQHCPGACHEHIIEEWDGVASGTFDAPDHEYPSHLELRLRATDEFGAKATVSRSLQPKTASISVGSSPAGLTIGVGEASVTTPNAGTAIVGSSLSLSAASPQLLGGVWYTFQSWSDGGGASHDVVIGAGGGTWLVTMLGGFSDIGASQFGMEITWAAAAGITSGCGGGRFCPLTPVTREQMAAFLVRGFALTAGGAPDQFTDIGASPFRAEINRLATAGVTSGCGGGRYCPLETVTRAEMAAFLVRALGLTAGGSPDRFTDIAASAFRAEINRLAAAGITSGCGGGRYCPEPVVTREQMVAFLYRALH